MDSFHIWYKWLLAWEGVSHVMTFDLDLYLQGHSTLFWLGIQHDTIVWVIMRRRGVSSERRRSSLASALTHWGRGTHICVSELSIVGSDNGLSPGRCQAIIWTNAGILLIGPLGTKFNEILIEIHTFSFKKMRLKVSSAKRQPFCLGLNVLMQCARW